MNSRVRIIDSWVQKMLFPITVVGAQIVNRIASSKRSATVDQHLIYRNLGMGH